MPPAPNGSSAQMTRDYLKLRYEMLPGMQYVYASHLQRFTRIARKRWKRLTTGQVAVITLLNFVKEYTGRPRYEDLAELLEQGAEGSYVARRLRGVCSAAVTCVSQADARAIPRLIFGGILG